MKRQVVLCTAALSHRWAHREPSAFHWILLLLFLSLLFAILERRGRQKENKISTPMHLLGAFLPPTCTRFVFLCFFFFLRGKSSETSIVPASCLNTEQLTLSSFCEYKPESCTFVDICAIQPTRKLKLRSRRIISAQQTKDSEHLLRRKDAHAN